MDYKFEPNYDFENIIFENESLFKQFLIEMVGEKKRVLNKANLNIKKKGKN